MVLNGETPEDWRLELEPHPYRPETGVDVSVEMAWQPEVGTMTGEALVWLAGARYTMRAEAVVMDASCGLPTGGSLTITDPEGNTALADFTDTTCEVPQVSVTHQGDTEQWTLFETP